MSKATKAPARAKGMSVHVGLNAVSPKHYEGWSGELMACEFDAADMAAIAKAQGMKSAVLLTKKATRANTLAAIRAAAKLLSSGDLFFLTYSGHGGQMPDITGDEPDKKDETWCLFDGELIDDELYLELSRFAKGVRVLVLSDSCHSGTVTRAMPREGSGRSKMMPPAVALRTYTKHQKFYDALQKKLAAEAGKSAALDPDIALAHAHTALSSRLAAVAGASKAAVILISGCQDNQTSMDGDHNGAFTEVVLRTWNQGKYKGNYAKFHAAIKSHMPSSQTPNLFTFGPVAEFAGQAPFKV